MQMELESEEGCKISIEFGSETLIGRELGLGSGLSADRTVSRRHLSLRLVDDPLDKFRVQFEVVGRNPIRVCDGHGGGWRIYKNSEKGELRVGDELSLSLKRPSFWVVKRRGEENEEDEEKRRALEAVERRERRTLERRREKQERAKEEVFDGEDDEKFGSLDVSQIDPVKDFDLTSRFSYFGAEFGFIMKGHEFDQYPKKMLDPRNWNWFIEETTGKSDDDDETIDQAACSREKKGRMRKKKGGKDDDDEWGGESEEEKVAVVKGGSTKRPKYFTRSKDPKRPRNVASGVRSPAAKKSINVLKNDNEEEDDDDDETLGGFIVDDKEEEEGGFDDEESEEEFNEEEDDDED